MNLITAAISAAALIGAVVAEISFSLPYAGTFWYTQTPNYLNVLSTNSEERFATIRFSGCNECFALSVTTNTTVPVVIPRNIRRNTHLNLYAISNFQNTAWSSVNVIDTLCVTAGNSCYDKLPCEGKRRRGCGYYAENDVNSQQSASASQSELAYVEYDSEEAKVMQSEQAQAAADLAQDIQEMESSSAPQAQQQA